MTKFSIVQRILTTAKTPEIAAHISQCIEIRVFSQLELLLEVHDLFASFYLQELSFGDFDSDFVTVRSCDREFFVEHFNEFFDFAR